MLSSVCIINANNRTQVAVSKGDENKFELNLGALLLEKCSTFEIEFVLDNKIKKIRNHDYEWVDFKKGFIAAEYAPKIFQLENGFFVQPNSNRGIWEVIDERTFIWTFNPEFSAPLTDYTGKNNEKVINQAERKINDSCSIALLFSKNNAIEFSRSKIPFSAVVCFTDHCDFDTAENLVLQRKLFKETGIKVTKGFFLNNYSKRVNASFEENSDEFDLWLQDGHELAYHSLSQSIKTLEESMIDFNSFSPPKSNIPVWIDHGYQPYNLSLYKNSGINSDAFSKLLSEKKISILWNYVDSGTSTNGVVNQMNSNDFTLESFYNGIKELPIKERMSLMIKNIMFHFYADEKKIILYKNLASNFKSFISKKSFSSLKDFIKNSFSVAKPLLKVVLLWNKVKKQSYKLAKYSPILFKHTIGENEFYVFQTLELIDFKKTLSNGNLEKMINEKGMFIGHTYFSAPMNYHTGRVFKKEDKIDDIVRDNFVSLGKLIDEKKIWNPVLSDMVRYLSGFEKVVLDIDDEGKIFVKESGNLLSREIFN
jgi:hypothetical protein